MRIKIQAIICIISILFVFTFLTACNNRVDYGGGFITDTTDTGEENPLDGNNGITESETAPPLGGGNTGAETDGGGQNKEEPEKEPQPVIQYAKYIVSKTNGLSVRSGAGSNYAALGRIDKGDMLAYIGKTGSWYITIYKERTAYVSASYCGLKELEKGGDKVESVIEEGHKLLGYPYVFGSQRYHWGNGKLNTAFKKGEFDCSALTLYIYYKGADVILDVTSRTQSLQGVTVQKKDIKRGDLLFFTNSSRYYNTGLERIGHVGVYLGGNYILHTASDYAVIEEISSARWNYFITAKRVI